MAGHSKWANIKHRKSAQDAIKSKIFQKLSKEITVAVAKGGNNPALNNSLRLAITKAKSYSMPKSNIEKALSAGCGTKNLAEFKESIHYGTIQNGITILMVCLSDNQVRLKANMQAAFNKVGGTIGKSGTIPFMFKRIGVLRMSVSDYNKEELSLWLLENEIEDFEFVDQTLEVQTKPNEVLKVKERLENKYPLVKFEQVEVIFFTNSKVKITDSEKRVKFEKFIEELEDWKDIHEVFHNAEV